MSEHIIEIPDYTSPFDPVARSVSLGEEIVRCRDCKFCMSYWGADYCDYFKHVTNDPDGFCAWACRKEQQ